MDFSYKAAPLCLLETELARFGSDLTEWSPLTPGVRGTDQFDTKFLNHSTAVSSPAALRQERYPLGRTEEI
jgi:hypothetical protein